MKPLFILLTGLFLVASTALAEEVTALDAEPDKLRLEGGPQIKFSETTFDFGKIKNTDTVRHDFIVTNTGNSLLQIRDVQPECGCTVADAWDHEVEPGKTGKIPIRFAPINFNGPVTKRILVYSNASLRPLTQLQITATVWSPIDLRPSSIKFIQIEGSSNEKKETKIVRIVNNLEEAITLEPPHCASSEFEVELRTVRPGKEFELSVAYIGTISASNSNIPITIKTSTDFMPELSINVSTVLQPALLSQPSEIVLPSGPLPEGYELSALVINCTPTPVRFSDPSINLPGITVSMQESEADKTVLFTFRPSPNFQAINGQAMELSVKTTHPKYPVFKIPIVQMTAE